MINNRLKPTAVVLWILICVNLLISPLFAKEKYVIEPWMIAETMHNLHWIEAEPNSPTAHFELAMTYAYTGRVLKGMAELGQLRPTFAMQVINYYTPLVEQEPKEWRHKFKLAFALYFGDKEKSWQMFDRILKENNPQQVWAMGYKALVLGELGHYAQTIAICEEALKIDRDAAGILYLLGEAYDKYPDAKQSGLGKKLLALKLAAELELKWMGLKREYHNKYR